MTKKESLPVVPEKQWLSIESPEGYSWWEYKDGNYSATLFESHQEGVEKKSVSIYFKGDLLEDNIFFYSSPGPRIAALQYIERQREESKAKVDPTIFEQARRAISRVKNRKESEEAAALFHGLTNSGKITREEESILEAFLVLKVAEFIREPQTTTELPGGYDSWFQIYSLSKNCHHEKQIKVDANPNALYSANFEEITTYLLDVDFVKARALDEISEFLPESAEEVSNMVYGMRQFMAYTNGDHSDSPIENKLLNMLRFYGENRIGRI